MAYTRWTNLLVFAGTFCLGGLTVLFGLRLIEMVDWVQPFSVLQIGAKKAPTTSTLQAQYVRPFIGRLNDIERRRAWIEYYAQVFKSNSTINMALQNRMGDASEQAFKALLDSTCLRTAAETGIPNANLVIDYISKSFRPDQADKALLFYYYAATPQLKSFIRLTIPSCRVKLWRIDQDDVYPFYLLATRDVDKLFEEYAEIISWRDLSRESKLLITEKLVQMLHVMQNTTSLTTIIDKYNQSPSSLKQFPRTRTNRISP